MFVWKQDVWAVQWDLGMYCGTDVALVVVREGEGRAGLQRKIRNLNISLQHCYVHTNT